MNRNLKGQFIKTKNAIIRKKFIVICPICKIKRLKCYKDYWAIKKGKTSERCRPCSRFKKGETNSGGFKKGIFPWNKGSGGSSKRDRIMKSKKWKDTRTIIFERDLYTCQKCYKIGGILHPHHIKSKSEHPKLIFILSNIITFCRDCHKKTDNYGYKARLLKDKKLN